MALSLHTLYAVDIDSVTIDQIVSQAVAPNVAQAVSAGDGQVFGSFVHAGRISPSISFSTTGLTAALTKLAPSGFALAAAALGTFFFRKRVKGGALEVGSNHIKALITEGIVVPRSLSADQDSSSLACDAIATYDGTNLPILVTGSQALTGTPTIAEQFVAGPVTINGVQLEGIVSIELDFGISLTIPAHDGQIYPMYAAIASFRPTLTIRTLDAVALSTFGVAGTAQGATPSVAYLRAKVDGGGTIANDVASHINIATTASKGMITVNELSAEQEGDATCEITITPTSAGVLHPLTITTGAVIPGAI